MPDPDETAAAAINPNLLAPESAKQKADTLAESFEGFSAAPYWDDAGQVWTQGFGSTHDDKCNPITANSPPITRETAIAWLEDDMNFAFMDIAEAVKVPLTDDERAALADFIYNVGSGNFNGSTMCRLINQGNMAAADAEFQRWDEAKGRVMPGLLRRRLAEADRFKGAIEA